MLSRRSLAMLAGGLFLFGTSGWIVAWKNSRGQETATIANEVPTRGGRTISRQDGRPLKSVPLLSDPKSMQLLHMIEEMQQGAVAGEPNKRFLNAADNVLLDSNFERRQRDLRILLEQMRPADAVELHHAFVALERSGRPLGEEYGAFAERWGEVDGAGAMAFFAAREPFDMKRLDLDKVMRGWGRSAPEQALVWIEENHSIVGAMNPRSSLIKGWFQQDPGTATAWLQRQEMPERELAECVTGAMIEQLYAGGPDHAAEWLASLQDGADFSNAARQGWDGMQYRLANLSYDNASALWSRVGGQSWMNMDQFERFCASVTRANQGDQAGFLTVLAEEWPAAQVTAQFERWAAAEPERIGQWLSQAPDVPLREAAIEGLIRTLQQTDPEAADAWLEELGEE